MVDAELKVKMFVKTGAALQIHIDAGRIRSDHGLERRIEETVLFGIFAGYRGVIATEFADLSAALLIHIDAGRIRSDHGLERSYRDSTGPETIIAMEEAGCLSQMWDSPATLTLNST
ncbi:hypothetical protein NL676_027301 [Syzygium grande]|nr:hypothetical protein NL676_027301 [Syzygium grande]